jgi:DNA-binding NarL/FixJ family response regulator
MDKKIRILVVDDHPLMREALQTALNQEADLEVVGEASDGAEALGMVARLQPDIILMDLLMPGIDGLETISRLFDENPQVRILVLTSLENEEKILATIQAGALGYFPKSAPRAYLLEAIRKVADGVPYLPTGIALKLFSGLRGLRAAPGGKKVAEPITARQEQILHLLGEGCSDIEIGKTLHLEEATVRSHVHNILQRLGLETRAQAAAYANRRQKP